MATTASIRTVLFDLAPSLTTEDTDTLARIDRFIVRAQNGINEDAAGSDYEEAVALLTWHNLLLSDRDAQGSAGDGLLLKEQVDNARYEFADATEYTGKYGETTPGRRLDSMMDKWIEEVWSW